MAKKHAITFAESAVGDIEEIRRWYTAQDAAAAGEGIIREIFTSIERLINFPESGRTVPEFNVPNLREIIHSPFRIVYRLDPPRIRIVRIWRSERLLKLT